jgi:hypothetical protein
VGNEEDIRLPLVLGPVSNGEFMPAAASAADIGLARAVNPQPRGPTRLAGDGDSTSGTG